LVPLKTENDNLREVHADLKEQMQIQVELEMRLRRDLNRNLNQDLGLKKRLAEAEKELAKQKTSKGQWADSMSLKGKYKTVNTISSWRS
jgi:hypothetical protein